MEDYATDLYSTQIYFQTFTFINASFTDNFTVMRVFKYPKICVTYKSTSIVVNVFLKKIISSNTRDLTGFKSCISKNNNHKQRLHQRHACIHVKIHRELQRSDQKGFAVELLTRVNAQGLGFGSSLDWSKMIRADLSRFRDERQKAGSALLKRQHHIPTNLSLIHI